MSGGHLRRPLPSAVRRYRDADADHLGQILPGQWDAFEAAFKKALEIRGHVEGLKGQWLLRDENDPDAGYSISQWESADAMQAFWDSKKRHEAMAVLQPFYVNQYTITNCAVRLASSD